VRSVYLGKNFELRPKAETDSNWTLTYEIHRRNWCDAT
jgi:hypothetical protein